MQLQEASSFVKNLKGAAISCLVLMWAVRESRRNWTRDDLAWLTGYSPEPVAAGLKMLSLHGLAMRMDRYTWQLTDAGYQLSFERGVEKIDSPPAQIESRTTGESNFSTREVKKFDSGSSSSFKEHVNYKHHVYLKPLLPQNGVEKIDSPPDDPAAAHLADLLIRAGSSPQRARNAICQALSAGALPLEIELRILWWRVYCLAHRSIGHAGNLIAARVAEGIDKPDDFGLKEIPDKYFEFKEQLEDLSREVEALHTTP